MAEPEAYLSVEAVAHYFGINRSTVYRLARRGVFPGLKVGGQWRFSKGRLESWVSDQVAMKQLVSNRRRAKR